MRYVGIKSGEKNMRPYCHGEKMTPTFRYLDYDGKICITYRCIFCGRKEEVELK